MSPAACEEGERTYIAESFLLRARDSFDFFELLRGKSEEVQENTEEERIYDIDKLYMILNG